MVINTCVDGYTCVDGSDGSFYTQEYTICLYCFFFSFSVITLMLKGEARPCEVSTSLAIATEREDLNYVWVVTILTGFFFVHILWVIVSESRKKKSGFSKYSKIVSSGVSAWVLKTRDWPMILRVMDGHISLWPATGTPDQCMSLVGYDRPPLQAPSIYIPYKDAVTCRNRAWTGPLPIAAGRFWHDSDTLRHLYTGCRSCRAKKCHIWWWSTQGWCLLIFGSRVQTHMITFWQASSLHCSRIACPTVKVICQLVLNFPVRRNWWLVRVSVSFLLDHCFKTGTQAEQEKFGKLHSVFKSDYHSATGHV